MSDIEDNMESEPPVIDPYEVLGLERTATQAEVKKAYHKAALRDHPDKVTESEKQSAHIIFQRIALAYAILSDPSRRARYDATGSTSDSILDSEGFDWSTYYRAAYADAVSDSAIKAFAAKYKDSDEERDDVLAAFVKHKGSMEAVYESVMLSNVLEDDERFRGIIDAAIESEEVEAYKKYTKESAKAKAARVKAAKGEKHEAEEYAREMGVHDKLFGGDATSDAVGKGKGKAKGKGKGKENGGEDALAALIMGRQKERSDAFLDQLAEKYGAGASSKKGKGKKGKQQPLEDEDEPDEEAFQAAAARLGRGKNKASEDAAPRTSKRSKR